MDSEAQNVNKEKSKSKKKKTSRKKKTVNKTKAKAMEVEVEAKVTEVEVEAKVADVDPSPNVKGEEKTEATNVQATPDQNKVSMEFDEIDSITLERLKAKIVNLTGYPIRVMCDKKWAQIPPDSNNVARVLYSVAFKERIEGVDIYSHGVNTITGLPSQQDDKYYLVLPEVRFLLSERSDLITHGELIHDGQTNRPLGFKNLFCSFDRSNLDENSTKQK